MKKLFLIITSGFALFAMFFGAGNLIFPLILGKETGQNWIVATAGFAITGVLVPVIGFVVTVLCKGCPKIFFEKIGRVPGMILITTIFTILGPCGCIPRCFSFTYSSFQVVFPHLSLGFFAALACSVTYLAAFRENGIVPLLGKVLTPLKIVNIALIFGCGFFIDEMSSPHVVSQSAASSLVLGLQDGYQTLDLLGAILFCAFLYPTFQKSAESQNMSMLKFSSYVALVSAVMLLITYTGFCYFSATLSHHFLHSPSELLLMDLTRHLVGDVGAYVTMGLVSLACLTTAIALSAVFADFIRKELFQEKVRYEYCLLITLVASYLFAILGFQGILAFLTPVLEICYPALMFLCLLNLADKVYGFRYVKAPFFTALGLSALRVLVF